MAGALVASLLRSGAPPQAQSQQPQWVSLTTDKLATAASDCYRREAAWQSTAYCASPVADVLEVVWASCFAEEKELLLAAIVDSEDDQTAMDYLAGVEASSKAEVTSRIEQMRLRADTCTRPSTESVTR
jgi:hypothetical protein